METPTAAAGVAGAAAWGGTAGSWWSAGPSSRPRAPTTYTRHKDTACKGDFSNAIFVYLRWKYFSKPLHMLINWTNQIVCFDQTLNKLALYRASHVSGLS